MTKREFTKFIFGSLDVNSERAESYYKEWKESGCDVAQWKLLLVTRG